MFLTFRQACRHTGTIFDFASKIPLQYQAGGLIERLLDALASDRNR